MVIQSAELNDGYITAVLSELKGVRGTLTLRDALGSNAFEAQLASPDGDSVPLNPEALRSLKPEIRSGINRLLSRRTQEMLATPGFKIRLTESREKAALLFHLYRKMPD